MLARCIRHGVTVLALGLAGVVSRPVLAQGVADFYRDKTITVLMGTGAGGSYDLYARVISNHMRRHMPGNPGFAITYMEGAGGARAGSYVYNVAPQDGTALLFTHPLPIIEKLRPDAVKYESARFNWIGAFDHISMVLAVWHGAPAQTLADMKRTEIVIGAFARDHASYQWARLTNEALGTKFRIVAGYNSGNAINLAMERGEVHGWAASWENLVATRPHWLAEKKVGLHLVYGLAPPAGLEGVPLLVDLAPAEKRPIVEFLAAGTTIARAVATTPNAPPERVAALRAAFAATMRDPEFLAEAKTRNLSVSPTPAAEVEALVRRIVSAPPDLMARIKDAIGAE